MEVDDSPRRSSDDVYPASMSCAIPAPRSHSRGARRVSRRRTSRTETWHSKGSSSSSPCPTPLTDGARSPRTSIATSAGGTSLALPGHAAERDSTASKAALTGLDMAAAVRSSQDCHAQRTKRSTHPVLAFMEHLEGTNAFHASSSVVIMLNAVFMMVSMERQINHFNQPAGTAMKVFECLFLAYYACEIFIRGLAHRWFFLTGDDFLWNGFGALLVLSMIFEMVLQDLGPDNISYLRTLRLIRMVKLLRFVRLMRQFHELRLVLDSILGSMRCMMWSCILISILTMMFGLTFLQATIDYLEESSAGGATHQGVEADLLLHWGSIGTAMMTLFKATTGGDDWSGAAGPLWEAGRHYYAIFVLYVAFWMFIFMNVLTSIFVDSVQSYAEEETQEIIRDQLDRRQEYMAKIVKLFMSIDKDGSGEVHFDEFNKHMGDPELSAFAASLDLEANDLEQFFSILSLGGRRKVSLETFVVGCIKLRGPAKSMDVTEMLLTQREGAEHQRFFEKRCMAEIGKLHHILRNVSAYPFDVGPATTPKPRGHSALKSRGEAVEIVDVAQTLPDPTEDEKMSITHLRL